MNTAPALSTSTRLASLALAALLTIATLGGVDGLATADSDAAQLAQQQSTTPVASARG